MIAFLFLFNMVFFSLIKLMLHITYFVSHTHIAYRILHIIQTKLIINKSDS